MIECNINNITKYFGADLIFEDISFAIKTNERIGLVGPNGSGKTTILKILTGEEHVQNGNVSFRKGNKIGYLNQIPSYSDDVIVDDILIGAFEDVIALRNNLDNVATSLGILTGEELDSALRKYGHLTAEFEQLDGYNMETNINKVATGLKIDTAMRELTFNVLSGGEKTRVMLARILLEHPNILLLDEPSNHLDLESIEWLEGYLREYSGSVLVVSHDRYFLDNVCEKIVELSTSKAHVYHGNYSYYVIEKERRFLLELNVYMNQQKKIKRMEDQIERYRIWGRMRDSDKMFKRAKELERRLSKVERLDKPIKDNAKMKIKSSTSTRSGKRVLEAKDINKRFDELELFRDATLDILFQDRLAILGKNGSGKSTLIKLLLEDFEQEEPSYKWGSKLKIGYLAQEVVFENEDVSVLDYFMNEHNVNQNKARAELAKALFIRDDVFKRISALSGGEKSKLKLCSLTYNQVNLMVLDEPTNHLDIDSREILEDLLLDYKGTILFVSHDRYFIKKIGTRIAEINNLQLDFYEGNYDYYKFMKSKYVITEEKKTLQTPQSTKKNTHNSKDKNLAYEQQLEQIDHKIELLNKEMERHPFDADKLQELYEEKQALLQDYENLFHKLL